MCPTQSSSPSARFVNWPQVDMSSTDSGYNEQSFTYVCMSTVDDLSYTPSAEERTRDAAQIAATGRRSWKTLKGKGEAVWPPHLEAALIEGKLLSSDIPDSSILAIHLALEKYQPDDSRSTKLFGRFPLRNRFISNYIFETTGKRRTPKQVGSRLQQLRDTCKGKRLLDLISNRNTSPTDCDPPISSPSPSSDNSIQATSPPPFRSHPQAKRTFIYVDILPEPLPWPSPFPIIRFTESGCNPLTIRFTSPPPDRDSSADPDLNNGVQSSSSSSHDPQNPVVTFASPSILHPQASFSVFLLGETTPVHSEVVPLICCASPLQGCEWTYSTTLVPGYWKTLCKCPDPSRYTIVQDIITIQNGSPDAGSIYPKPSTGDPNDNGATFSVVFRFSHSNATPAPLLAPHILQRPSDVDFVLSPTNTESSTASPFTPSSSVSVSTNFRVPLATYSQALCSANSVCYRLRINFCLPCVCCFTDEIETFSLTVEFFASYHSS
jgi:hypothetical protein